MTALRLFRVWLEGPETEWEFREAPDYYTKDGKRRDGQQAPKVVKPAVGFSELYAPDADHASARAVRANPEYHKVVSVEAIG